MFPKHLGYKNSEKMPKPQTFPFLFDKVKHIDISFLRKQGYLENNYSKSGTLTWSSNGIKTSEISITTKMLNSNKALIINYNCNNESYKYEIPLVPIPSNLGKGIVWYFFCPFTNKRCRKLHFIDQRFMHRSALPNGMYEKQIKSKNWRQMEQIYGCHFELDQNYQELYKKHLKKHYKGKPTKKYLKLMEKISQGERFSVDEIERLFII